MKLNHNVTQAVIDAGQAVCDALMKVTIAKSMGGLGGSITWEQFLEHDFPNRDIVIAYLNEEILSVTAIYLAMQRAAPARQPLTIREINALPEARGSWPMAMNDRVVALIRAVERAHGIKPSV